MYFSNNYQILYKASTDLIFVFIWGYYIENYGKQKKISKKNFFGLASEKTDKKPGKLPKNGLFAASN